MSFTDGLMVHSEFLQLLGGHFGGTMTRGKKYLCIYSISFTIPQP
jgi:hypothetical protein